MRMATSPFNPNPPPKSDPTTGAGGTNSSTDKGTPSTPPSSPPGSPFNPNPNQSTAPPGSGRTGGGSRGGGGSSGGGNSGGNSQTVTSSDGSKTTTTETVDTTTGKSLTTVQRFDASGRLTEQATLDEQGNVKYARSVGGSVGGARGSVQQQGPNAYSPIDPVTGQPRAVSVNPSTYTPTFAELADPIVASSASGGYIPNSRAVPKEKTVFGADVLPASRQVASVQKTKPAEVKNVVADVGNDIDPRTGRPYGRIEAAPSPNQYSAGERLLLGAYDFAKQFQRGTEIGESGDTRGAGKGYEENGNLVPSPFNYNADYTFAERLGALYGRTKGPTKEAVKAGATAAVIVEGGAAVVGAGLAGGSLVASFAGASRTAVALTEAAAAARSVRPITSLAAEGVALASDAVPAVRSAVGAFDAFESALSNNRFTNFVYRGATAIGENYLIDKSVKGVTTLSNQEDYRRIENQYGLSVRDLDRLNAIGFEAQNKAAGEIGGIRVAGVAITPAGFANNVYASLGRDFTNNAYGKAVNQELINQGYSPQERRDILDAVETRFRASQTSEVLQSLNINRATELYGRQDVAAKIGSNGMRSFENTKDAADYVGKNIRYTLVRGGALEGAETYMLQQRSRGLEATPQSVAVNAAIGGATATLLGEPIARTSISNPRQSAGLQLLGNLGDPYELPGDELATYTQNVRRDFKLSNADEVAFRVRSKQVDVALTDAFASNAAAQSQTSNKQVFPTEIPLTVNTQTTYPTEIYFNTELPNQTPLPTIVPVTVTQSNPTPEETNVPVNVNVPVNLPATVQLPITTPFSRLPVPLPFAPNVGDVGSTAKGKNANKYYDEVAQSFKAFNLGFGADVLPTSQKANKGRSGKRVTPEGLANQLLKRVLR